MAEPKGDKLFVNLGASQVRRRLKGFGHGVRKVQSAGRNQAAIIHTATGHHLRELEQKFADVGWAASENDLSSDRLQNLKGVAMEVRRKSLGRKLTPEEAAHYRRIAELADSEIPEVRRRIKEQGYFGHLVADDVKEVVSLGAFLKSERERQGLDLAEIARRSGAKADDLQALEEGRFSEPPVSLLTRYARAVGKSLMLGLRQADPLPAPGQPTVEQLVEAPA